MKKDIRSYGYVAEKYFRKECRNISDVELINGTMYYPRNEVIKLMADFAASNMHKKETLLHEKNTKLK